MKGISLHLVHRYQGEKRSVFVRFPAGFRGAKNRQMMRDESLPLQICFPFADRARSVGGSHISAMTLIERLDRSRFDPKIILIGEQGSVDRLAVNSGQSPERILPDAKGNPTFFDSIRVVREAVRVLSSGKFKHNVQ